MQRRTYIDSGVLLAVIRGKPEIAAKALQVLDDPQRLLVVSAAVRLEVMPKAIFEKRQDEQAEFEQFFQQTEEIPWSVEILQKAYDLACEYGLAALDSIHLGFAVAAGTDEFITTEKTTKPLFRFNRENNKPLVRSLPEL